jgi:hypothetical protein
MKIKLRYGYDDVKVKPGCENLVIRFFELREMFRHSEKMLNDELITTEDYQNICEKFYQIHNSVNNTDVIDGVQQDCAYFQSYFYED